MAEICCANCRIYTGNENCPCNNYENCLYRDYGSYKMQGQHHNSYNHFVPKEDKRCLDCHYSISGRDCPSGIDDCLANKHRDFNPKEDKMAYIPTNIASTTSYYSGKPDKVEYKATGKSLTARQVIAESKIVLTELERFLKWHKHHKAWGHGKGSSTLEADLFSSDGFLAYALQHDCFRDFLLAGKYIEKVDTWVSPKVGDRFRYKGDEYILYSLSQGYWTYIMPITGTKAGQRSYDRGYAITDPKGITKEEFQKICGSIPIEELERI